LERLSSLVEADTLAFGEQLLMARLLVRIFSASFFTAETSASDETVRVKSSEGCGFPSE